MNDRVEKLRFDIYPELVSSTRKAKCLNQYAVWSVLKVVDAHKQGSGKFLLSSVLTVITRTIHCNSNYAYEIFAKGIGKFWHQPNDEKVVYLFSLDKVVKNFPFDLAKTSPFDVRVYDLWNLETSGQVKNFLNTLVVGRYGQGKPLSQQALMENLDVSLSTVKRIIKNSDWITKKKNFCIIKSYKNLSFANKFLEKIRLLDPHHRLKYKIITDNGMYLVIKQMANSYSVEDFSRSKISKRPKALRNIDHDNKDSFEKKKYNIKENGFVKQKAEGSEFYLWQSSDNQFKNIEPFENGKNKTRTRYDSKFWLMKKTEQE